MEASPEVACTTSLEQYQLVQTDRPDFSPAWVVIPTGAHDCLLTVQRTEVPLDAEYWRSVGSRCESPTFSASPEPASPRRRFRRAVPCVASPSTWTRSRFLSRRFELSTNASTGAARSSR